MKSKQSMMPAKTGVAGQVSKEAGKRWGQLTDNNEDKSACKKRNSSVEQAFIERHPLDGDSQRAGHQADRQSLDEDGCFLG